MYKNQLKYDYMIVGAGLFGSVFAHEATKKGKKCIIIDKRHHIAGNCYTEKKDNINIHKYGPHIFNTNNKFIWDYINKIHDFDHYQHKVKVNYNDKIFSFPLNLSTFNELWGMTDIEKIQRRIEKERLKTDRPANLEEWVLSKVGKEIYETFYKGYSEKQWGTDCKNIPCDIRKRLPIRFTYNDNYHNSLFSGIPSGGSYTEVFKNLLDGIQVELDTDFYTKLNKTWQQYAKKLVYTGPIDKFFDYSCGALEYRSLKFKTKKIQKENYQGISQMNFTDKSIPYTRIIEHKHFSTCKSEVTYITHEYPEKWKNGKEMYYPINNEKNNAILREYNSLKQSQKDVVISGRMGSYKYIDMDACIALAIKEEKNQS